jgi:large subunit ribosomal protein L4
MELKIYNQDGKETGKIRLPAEIFGLAWNPDLVHQVMLAMFANKRRSTAHAKTRAEVRGGGKKPWRQKGTGRARHGSIRSPIWRGGGVTFGPTKEKIYTQKINKKMKRKALLVALSQKARDNEILILDDLKLKAPKTKEAAAVLKALKLKGTSLFLLPQKNETLTRSFRNLTNINTGLAGNLNLLDILNHKYLVFITKEVVNAFKLSSK